MKWDALTLIWCHLIDVFSFQTSFGGCVQVEGTSLHHGDVGCENVEWEITTPCSWRDGLNSRYAHVCGKVVYIHYNPRNIYTTIPVSKVHGLKWGLSGADRTQVGPCWPHELCYLGCCSTCYLGYAISFWSSFRSIHLCSLGLLIDTRAIVIEDCPVTGKSLWRIWTKLVGTSTDPNTTKNDPGNSSVDVIIYIKQFGIKLLIHSQTWAIHRWSLRMSK